MFVINIGHLEFGIVCQAAVLENVLGIAAIMDDVLSLLQEALPGYRIEYHILDPTLVFHWLIDDPSSCQGC